MRARSVAFVMVLCTAGLADASEAKDVAAGPFAAYTAPLAPIVTENEPAPFGSGRFLNPGARSSRAKRAAALPVCSIQVLRPAGAVDLSMVRDLPNDVDRAFTRAASCADVR